MKRNRAIGRSFRTPGCLLRRQSSRPCPSRAEPRSQRLNPAFLDRSSPWNEVDPLGHCLPDYAGISSCVDPAMKAIHAACCDSADLPARSACPFEPHAARYGNERGGRNRLYQCKSGGPPATSAQLGPLGTCPPPSRPGPAGNLYSDSSITVPRQIVTSAGAAPNGCPIVAHFCLLAGSRGPASGAHVASVIPAAKVCLSPGQLGAISAVRAPASNHAA